MSPWSIQSVAYIARRYCPNSSVVHVRLEGDRIRWEAR